MDPTLEAFLQSWPLDPWLVVPLLAAALIYVRGWRQLRRRGARRFQPRQLHAFLAGLAVLILALASPIDPFADLLLQVHMLQHLLLMMVAPPLLWLGDPLIPLLRGLPIPIRTYWAGPFFRLSAVRTIFHHLTHPGVAWLLYIAATWLWHVPRFYEVALASPAWHYLEHVAFLGTGLLFWWPVIQPFPSRPRWPRWTMLPYLLFADVQNTILSAVLTFSDTVLYPHYAAAPRLWGMSALDDQVAAGVLMWVPGSLAYLIPLVWIGSRLLYGDAIHARLRGTGQGIWTTGMDPLSPSPLVGEGRGGGAEEPSVRRSLRSTAGGEWREHTPSPLGGEGRGGGAEVPGVQGLLVDSVTAGGEGQVHTMTAPPAPAAKRLPLPLVTSSKPLKPSSISASPRPRVPASAFDLLHVPFLGRFLGWRHARLALQVPMFVAAIVLILDGLWGPPIAPLNLAGVLPWIHWRGLIVLGLLVAGNFFCTACPFLLPRTLARKWLPARHAWPRWLRSKWLAAGLLVLFFWAYEAFALWASPWWTAWIAVGYFVAAFAIDGWFRGAAFCKYVCPIGQFNFVQSLVSPLEIRVRDAALCQTCTTKDCIRGTSSVPGCELHLFQPRKAGNLDCTFCLDCIHACPHDNVGILATPPAAELWRDPHRSGIGRFSRRPDLAALVLVLVFAAFANAAGMVGPVVAWEDRLAAALRLSSPLWIVTAFFLVALFALPALLVGSAALLSRWWSSERGRFLDVTTRFAYALVPLGFGMWLTHYSFHFFTSYDAIVPAAQRWAADVGLMFLGTPAWHCGCCVSVASWILRLEIVFLDLGLLLSLYTAYRIALERSPQLPLALRAFAPWAALLLLLFAVGIWIVFQPMQMRGTVQMPG